MPGNTSIGDDDMPVLLRDLIDPVLAAIMARALWAHQRPHPQADGDGDGLHAPPPDGTDAGEGTP